MLLPRNERKKKKKKRKKQRTTDIDVERIQTETERGISVLWLKNRLCSLYRGERSAGKTEDLVKIARLDDPAAKLLKLSKCIIDERKKLLELYMYVRFDKNQRYRAKA